ncbi:MAG: shikimate kinase [Gemmatimonadota bacterium]|nr:shikimate kinase [Gemmatimonadota bacterium]
MRLLVFGNSGSGKTTLALAIAEQHGLHHLDLDTIVWEPEQVAVERPPEDRLADLRSFLERHDCWVIEGCYGELVEAAADRCTRLVFLNPGAEACLGNNRRRPWEPHKYDTPEAQDEMLDALQAWVREYYTRGGSWSYEAHRRIFDTHRGDKVESTSSPPPDDLI